MKRAHICMASLVFPLLLLSGAHARSRHDPLNEKEIDELRDAAQDADTRIKLYLKFAQERLDMLDKIRNDSQVTDRGQQIHDSLQDFVDVYDELNENIETYAKRREDIRKTLKVVIETDRVFQARLQALRDSPGNKDELKLYDFTLMDASEDLESGASDHVHVLANQEIAAKQKRLLKPQVPGRGNPMPQ